jgi:hypothetical protein
MLVVAIVIGLVLAAAYFLFVYDNGFSGFVRTVVIPREPEQRPEGTLRTVYFPAVDGTRLEGWLVAPATVPVPLVIMAPGLTGTKDGHLEPFAWRFARAGLAVLMVDFRCFGGSDGEPRHWVDPFRQVDDYRAAIRFAAGPLASDGIIDPSRIALWGSSFSGGSAIVAAAASREVAALVAQCPFVATPESQEPSRSAMLRYVAWTMLDLVRSRLGLAPVYLPAFGQPGELAFATSRGNPSRFDPSRPGATFWRTLPPPRGGWENKLVARFLADFDKFKPKDAIASVGCPVYLVAAESDDMVPLQFVKDAHDLIAHDHRELTVHPCGHFDLYVEPILHENADLQADFLARHLGGNVAGRRAAATPRG